MTQTPGPAVPQARMPLRIMFILAVLWAVITTVGTLIVVTQDLFARDVTVSTPVALFYPKVNPTLHLDGPTASLTGGGYDHATFSLAGLHWDARALLAGGAFLQGITAILLAVTLAMLCSRVANGRPFAPTVTRAIALSGITILVGGVLWQVCFELGQYLAVTQAFTISSGNWKTTVAGITPSSTSWPHASNNFVIDFWPIGIAFALFALAAVFRYGATIERDRAMLLRETEGLV